MNPVTWCFTVTLGPANVTLADDAPPADGHHEPLMAGIMNPLAWCSTVTLPWS